MHFRLSLIVVLLLAAFVVFPAQAAETIKWKAQCWVGTADLSYESFLAFCQRVKSATNGRLEITPYPDGAIVAATEMLDAVENNVLQAMVGAPIYWSGKDPAFALLADPNCAWEHPQEVDTFYHRYGGLELLREAYRPFNVYPVGVTWVGAEVMPSTKCVSKVDDFKGLKWRTPQGIPAETFKRMGASPMNLPGSEVYSSLEKGIIDGCDWGTPSMNHRMGFTQVAKYYNWPGFHSMSTMDFSVNLEEWEKLPEDIKSILTAAVREFAWDMVERQTDDSYRALTAMKEQGAVACVWSDEELAKVRAIAKEVWAEWAAKSPLCQKVYDALMVYLKVLGR